MLIAINLGGEYVDILDTEDSTVERTYINDVKEALKLGVLICFK